ncbi:MAG: cellulose-binding domain-containing protein [Kineosporiaceae bacterium]
MVLSIGTVAAVAAVTGIVTSLPASASSGCTVAYRTTVQWPGGFGADVDIHNLGDPVDTWTLDWSFPAGQELTQAWNATATQNGARVTATDAGYNRSLDTGGNVSFGFLGTWTGSNPDPTSFRLNGVTCSGEVTTPDPTAPVTSPATGEPSATASPTTSTPTSTTTSTTPTTPVTSPATGGVPDDAAWVASGQWDSWTEDEHQTQRVGVSDQFLRRVGAG